MKTKLRIKCTNCGHWNRIEVEKVLFTQIVQILGTSVLPSYLPLKVAKCEKCKGIIAEPPELIRIIHKERE